MFSFAYSRSLILPLGRFVIVLVVLIFPCQRVAYTQQPQPGNSIPKLAASTTVSLRWGAHAGVVRYRLQLASDAGFADIVLDRVVTGHEYQISDLPPGKYFWRVVPVGRNFTESSSAGIIEVRPAPVNNQTAAQNAAIQKPTHARPSPIVAESGGWYAAIGNVSTSVLAHLRSPGYEDVVATSNDGRLIALDARTGVALWTIRLQAQSSVAPLAMRSPSGFDNIVLFAANAASMLDGKTGRRLWQSTLPAPVSRGLAINGRIFALDNSLQKLLVLNGATGQLIAQTQLTRRAVGAPAAFELQPRAVIVALEDGRIQVIDETGKVLREGSAESAATTAPVFVRGARGTFVLVGTKDGLTALNAADLRPLGRISLKNDTPRGALTAVDIDGDHNPEVVMLTARGRIFAIKSDEGRTLWDSDARQADAIAFADVNNDGALDLLMMSREGFAFALSGRDGALLWKEDEGAIAANHAPPARPRSIIVAHTSLGALFITIDAGRGGLRATQFQPVAR